MLLCSSPPKLQFTATDYRSPQVLRLTGVEDYVNGGGDSQYSLSCDVTSTPTVGGLSVFADGKLNFPAITLDVYFPYFEDALVLRDGAFVSSVVGGSAFLAVTLGSEVVRLVADTKYRLKRGPAFLPGVTVTLGGVLVPSAVLNNGYWLEFETPSSSAMCPTASSCTGEAAYKALVVTNPYAAPGGEVACPDTCPGTASSGGFLYSYAPCGPGFLFGSPCLDPAQAQLCGLKPATVRARTTQPL